MEMNILPSAATGTPLSCPGFINLRQKFLMMAAKRLYEVSQKK
jgi:hypothetical protein